MKVTTLKRILGVVLATTLVISSSLVVFAADGESPDGETSAGSEITGTGSVEDYVKKDVFKVVLPTVTNVNFTMDPQGLLSIADSDTYKLEAGAVYFANAGENGTEYSATSDAITIANKSSYDVDVEFSIELTAPDGVTIVESKDALADATTPSLYLAMAVGDADATALKTGVNAAEAQTVAKIAEDQTTKNGYYIKAEGAAPDFTYTYVLDENYTGTPASVSYTITGACDSTANWSAVKDLTASAKIVWSAEKHSDNAAPSIATKTYPLVKDTAVDVAVNLGAGELAAETVTSVTYVSNGKTLELPTTAWSYADGTLTITAERVNALITAGNDKVYTVNFDDAANTAVDITLTIS